MTTIKCGPAHRSTSNEAALKGLGNTDTHMMTTWTKLVLAACIMGAGNSALTSSSSPRIRSLLLHVDVWLFPAGGVDSGGSASSDRESTTDDDASIDSKFAMDYAVPRSRIPL